MRHNLSTLLFIFAFICADALAANPAPAQTAAPAVSTASLQAAKLIANACLPGWETQTCMKAISQSSYVMVSNYGGDLEGRNKKADAEILKQHCAATTAATQQDVPPYAMRSALTECAGVISDLAAKTGVNPDLSHFQLMVIPAMCLAQDPNCPALTAQLKQFAGP